MCGKDPEHVAKCHLAIIYLVIDLRSGQRAKILMRPSMAGNLMARIVHSLHQTLAGVSNLEMRTT